MSLMKICMYTVRVLHAWAFVSTEAHTLCIFSLFCICIAVLPPCTPQSHKTEQVIFTLQHVPVCNFCTIYINDCLKTCRKVVQQPLPLSPVKSMRVECLGCPLQMAGTIYLHRECAKFLATDACTLTAAVSSAALSANKPVLYTVIRFVSTSANLAFAPSWV